MKRKQSSDEKTYIAVTSENTQLTITQKYLISSWFSRAKAECFARLCHRLGVCLSVRPSVCHTRDLYQNGAS